HRGIGVALDGAEAVHAVDHVLGGQFSAVDRRLTVPAHAPAKLEDVRGLVWLAPGLGQVALYREGARNHAGATLVLDEPAVGERVHDMRLVRHLQIRIEMRWVPEPEGNRAATLRGLGADRRRQQRRAHQGHTSDAKEIATLHVRPPCRAPRGVRAEQQALGSGATAGIVALQFFTRGSFSQHISAPSFKEGGARAMKRIISLVSIGVLSLALATPVLADQQHDRRVRDPHVQSARFEHFRSFRRPFVQTYYYPYPSYVYYPYPVYYPEVGAEESPWVDPAPEVQREVVFSTGKYVLQSDGGDSYRWVWV